MKKILPILNNIKLFENLNDNQILNLLEKSQAIIRHYHSSNIVLDSNSKCDKIQIVVNGNLKNVKIDYNGNQTLIANLQKGDIFAEAFVCANEKLTNIMIITESECEILEFDFNACLNNDTIGSEIKLKLASNMISILSKKSIYLNKKLNHISNRRIRDKILSYLNDIKVTSNKKIFTIPFNREELANYLCVDRCCLCTELNKLKKEGIIDFDKNTFIIK